METRNSYFCLTPKNHRLIFVSWKHLKSQPQKKVTLRFNNFRWREFLKVAAFAIFLTSIVFVHFLNELRVSFKDNFSNLFKNIGDENWNTN